MNTKINTIDEYISTFPLEIQKKLKQIKKTIHILTPNSKECICYGIPTFKLNGKNLVHFAGYKTHIGFYPTSSGIIEFEHEISKYKYSKGTIQFPHDKEIPYELIKKIVKFRIKENNFI